MTKTIQNLAKAFLGLFIFLIIFTPLFVFAQSNITTNNSLPTEESFMEMWEKRIKNDSGTMIFKKIEEGKYHFKTNRFLFDDELEVVSIEIGENILKGCVSEYTVANINLRFTDIPEISEFRTEYQGIKMQYRKNQNVINYSDWHFDHTYFYYDYRAEEWLSEKEFNDQESECRKQIPLENRVREDWPEMLPFMYLAKYQIIIFIFLFAFFWLIGRKAKSNNKLNDVGTKKPFSSSNIEIKEGFSFGEFIIIIPKNPKRKSEASEKAWLLMTVLGFGLILFVALGASLNPNGGVVYKFIEDISSSKSIPLFYWYNFLGIIIFIPLFFLFLIFTIYKSSGSEKIQVSRTRNFIIYSSNLPFMSLFPEFLFRKTELRIDQAMIKLSESSDFFSIVSGKKKKLHLFFEKKFFEIASQYSNKEKERIYNVLKKYIREKK